MKLLLCLAFVAIFPSLAHAGNGKRVALVIGNANYQPSGKLNNTLRDAAGMATNLRELGFEVIAETDANRDGMLRAINTFGSKIANADVCLFYFSGHGLQMKGSNYLVPIGATLESEAEVEVEMVDANRVLAKMNTAAADVNLVILDCCRNDPFERGFRDTGGSGLVAMDAPKGTMIAYATAPGTVASDGDPGGFGLYTGCLLQEMRKPGLSVERMFKNVRLAVTKKKAKQVPWESSSLTGEFFFAKAEGASEGKPQAPAVPANLPPGTYDGTIVFNYPDRSTVTSRRIIQVGTSQTELTLRSTDVYEADKKRTYASHVILQGESRGATFYSQAQKVIATDYSRWADEAMRIEFAPDGSAAILTATFRDKGKLVVGTGVLSRSKP